MKHTFSVPLVLILVITAFTGQVTVARTVEAPTPPVDQLTLRIVDGNGYTTMTNAAGIPLIGETAQVVNGEFHPALNQSTKDLYTQLGVRNSHSTITNMVPPRLSTASNISSTSVTMRVMVFADVNAAESYVVDAIGLVSAGAVGAESDLTLLGSLPEYDQAIIGFTGFTQFKDTDSGEPLGYFPYTRYMAQDELTVASAKVAGGEDATLNEAIARELLFEQLACIQADTVCEPVPLPLASPTSMAATGQPLKAEHDQETPTGVVRRANIRANPSTVADVVAVAARGDRLTITGEGVDANGYRWLPVIASSGIDGWIANTLVSQDP